MNPLQKLERILRELFRKIPTGTSQNPEPIEIRRQILSDIVDKVQTKGHGEYFFPYTQVIVEILARNATEQQTFEASFDPHGFAEEVVSEVAKRGCDVRNMTVQAEVKADPIASSQYPPYRIQYQRTPLAPKQSIPRPPARLLVLDGRSEVKELTIERDLVYVGRLKEVMHSRSGLERRNDLAFDASEVTVSRKHAWLQYDPATGKFRVYNDPASQLGTRVFRDGKIISCDSARGVQLRPGDEILLGDARILVEISAATVRGD